MFCLPFYPAKGPPCRARSRPHTVCEQELSTGLRSLERCLRFWTQSRKELVCRQCIQYISFCKPCTTQLAHSVTQLFHVAGMVCIGIDNNFAAHLFCHAQVAIAEVQSVRISIVFNGNAQFCGTAKYPRQMNLVCFTAKKKSSCR